MAEEISEIPQSGLARSQLIPELRSPRETGKSGAYARGTKGSPLLKAFAAVHGAALRRLEGHGRFFPTLRADRFRFHSLDGGRRRFTALDANRLATLATLGLVLEALVREKHLLAGGEDEFSPALGALQNFVMVFHTLLRGPCSHRASRWQTVADEG